MHPVETSGGKTNNNNKIKGSRFAVRAVLSCGFGFACLQIPAVSRTMHMLKWLQVPNAEMIAQLYDDMNATTPDEMFRNVFSTCPILYFADSLAASGNNSVFLYAIRQSPSYDRPGGTGNSTGQKTLARFEDLEYLFGLPLTNRYRASAMDKQMSRTLIKIWTDFVKTGSVRGSSCFRSSNAFTEIDLMVQTVTYLFGRRCTVMI